jgi:hypothetical protein
MGTRDAIACRQAPGKMKRQERGSNPRQGACSRGVPWIAGYKPAALPLGHPAKSHLGLAGFVPQRTSPARPFCARRYGDISRRAAALLMAHLLSEGCLDYARQSPMRPDRAMSRDMHTHAPGYPGTLTTIDLGCSSLRRRFAGRIESAASHSACETSFQLCPVCLR